MSIDCVSGSGGGSGGGGGDDGVVIAGHGMHQSVNCTAVTLTVHEGDGGKNGIMYPLLAYLLVVV